MRRERSYLEQIEQMVGESLRGNDVARRDLARETPPISIVTWDDGKIPAQIVVAGDDSRLAWVRTVENGRLLHGDILPQLTSAERAEVRLLHGRAVLGWMTEEELSPAVNRKPATYPVMKFKRRWNVDVRKGPPVTATVEGLTFQLDGAIARRVGGSPLTEELLSQARAVCEQVLLAVTKEPRPR